MQPDKDLKLLSRQEVADIFGISKRYLETADAKGEGPTTIRFGRLVRYRVKDIKAWIEANATSEVNQ